MAARWRCCCIFPSQSEFPALRLLTACPAGPPGTASAARQGTAAPPWCVRLRRRRLRALEWVAWSVQPAAALRAARRAAVAEARPCSRPAAGGSLPASWPSPLASTVFCWWAGGQSSGRRRSRRQRWVASWMRRLPSRHSMAGAGPTPSCSPCCPQGCSPVLSPLNAAKRFVFLVLSSTLFTHPRQHTHSGSTDLSHRYCTR